MTETLDTVDTYTLRHLHRGAAQGPFRAEIDATNRGRYDAHSITDDYGAVATGIDPKTAEYWVAVLADAPALFDAAEERDNLRKQLSATLDQLELRKDTVLWRDLQEVMRQHNETIAERDALRAENERLREALERIRDLTPFAANVDTAAHMHSAVRAIASVALDDELTLEPTHE